MTQFQLELVKAALTALISLGTLLAGWKFGEKFTYRWAVKQRRRELQLDTTKRFYEAYGEFFITWKLWNHLDGNREDYVDKRWELLSRASVCEANIEATILKLVTENGLGRTEVVSLGRFRQAFQSLREAIIEGSPLGWHSSDQRDYLTFKRLACEIASLLGSDWVSSSRNADTAFDNLRAITSNQWEHRWAD